MCHLSSTVYESHTSRKKTAQQIEYMSYNARLTGLDSPVPHRNTMDATEKEISKSVKRVLVLFLLPGVSASLSSLSLIIKN